MKVLTILFFIKLYFIKNIELLYSIRRDKEQFGYPEEYQEFLKKKKEK